MDCEQCGKKFEDGQAIVEIKCNGHYVCDNDSCVNNYLFEHADLRHIPYDSEMDSEAD